MSTGTALSDEGRIVIPSSWVELPREGEGFYAKPKAKHLWGREEVIAALLEAGRKWKAMGHPPFCVTEISKRGGGELPPHKGHRDGLHVDLRPMRRDDLPLPVTCRQKEYSTERTRDLVIVLLNNSVWPVTSILFNDPAIVAVTRYAGHDNHLHVEFGKGE